jgi:hypothetical protein
MVQDAERRTALVMDVDRDGRDDLLFTVRDYATYDYNNGTYSITDAVIALLSNGDGSFTRDDIVGVDPGLGLRTGNFNGDGRKDLLAVTPDGYLKMYLEQGQDDADLLAVVWDDDASKEPRLQVEYGRTNPADWASATCTFPTLCLRHGARVVASVSGLDVGSPTYYRFEEPRLDLGGRGFLGYATVRVWNPARPMERTTTFDNVTRVGTIYPNAQRPKSVRTVVPIVDHGPEERPDLGDDVRLRAARASGRSLALRLHAGDARARVGGERRDRLERSFTAPHHRDRRSGAGRRSPPARRLVPGRRLQQPAVGE